MKKSLIPLIIVVLTVSAFLIRFENFRNSRAVAIDEIVYFRMGLQMTRNLADYNTIPYGQELSATGRPLPQYFFEPLFKHPPLFTLLVTASLKAFGPSLASAEYVSLASSILMIPLIYLLGTLIFGRIVGLLSAFLLWMDPIHIITSQKAWMDNTIAFFTLLTVVLFVYALKNNKDLYFILSGVAGGLAANTKYTGILATMAVVLFAVIYRRDLFKKPAFNISLLLPFVLLLPWFLWNCQIYGWELLLRRDNDNDTEYFLKLFRDVRLWGAGLLGALGYFLFPLIKRSGYRPAVPKLSSFTSIVLFIAVSTIFLRQAIINSLQLSYFPSTSWGQGLFSGVPTWFYFERLIEFSPLYFFAFMAIFIHDSTTPPAAAILRLSAIVILLFFIAWGNYQSRYILSSLPFLLILAASMIQKIYLKLTSLPGFLPRTLSIFSFLLLISYAMLKIAYLNTFVSFPHNFCYY